MVKTENSYIIIDKDTIIRAITAVLHYKFGYKNRKEYKEEISIMKNIGFIYIEEIANILLLNQIFKVN